MKIHSKSTFTKAIIGLVAICITSTTVFAEVTFSDGSISRALPTVTLKKKTIKFFRKRYERKWTMNTYARILESENGIKINGRTEVKSTFHLTGFTGGVFVDVKDADGNLIYRVSARTGTEASGYENGHDVGWGVNPKSSRTKSWEVILPPELGLFAKTIDIYQIRTKKKIDWNKAKAKFGEIAKNLGNAIKKFFESNGDEVILLGVKYGPQIDEMRKAAKEGTLQFTEVCEVMNNILVDAEAYDMISSAKAQNLINIIDAVEEIVVNGKGGWAPKNQELIVALIQDIVSLIGEKNVSDARLTSILDNFEAFLNDKSGLVGENLQSIEVVLVNAKALINDKLNKQQAEAFDTVIEFVSKINDYGQDPLLKQEKLDSIFQAARSIIAIRSHALAGTLTPDFIHENLVAFIDANYLVLALTEEQNLAIENIIASTVNIVNNSTEGLLPVNQEQIVDLIITVEQIAAGKAINYNLISKLINDLEKLCNDKSGFVPSSLLDIEVILTNIHFLIAPKLNDGSKVEEIFNTVITTISTINNWQEVAIVNNLSVVFNGLRLGVDLLEKAQNKTITAEYAQTQFDNWYAELAPVLKSIYPEKADEIDAIKNIIDNTFAIIINGKEGWNFDHWNAVVDIVKAGIEVIQTENQLEIAFTFLRLKADFEVLLESKADFVVDNGTYVENIIENLAVLSAGNEKVYNAVSKLIEYLEEYNSWNNEAAA